MKEVVTSAIGAERPLFAWIRYDSFDSPGMRFVRTVHARGADSTIAEFRNLLDHGQISEGVIDSLGYRLMEQKRMSDAIRVFRLNITLHPKSANAYDSLAEAYMNIGEKALAIENYSQSLELDPQNANAGEMLRKLKGD